MPQTKTAKSSKAAPSPKGDKSSKAGKSSKDGKSSKASKSSTLIAASKAAVVLEDTVDSPAVHARRLAGEAAREVAALDSHAGWAAGADRPDPVALLEEQDQAREQDLVPVRHGRMAVSPFTFYRGAAKIMAADLSATPNAGLTVQLCGDAHLSNFGVFASPERNLVFDLNDFDETLPGPFEWDVKRMAASFAIAAQNNGFTEHEVIRITLASVRAYRETMAVFAGMGLMDTWYAHLSTTRLLADLERVADRDRVGSKDRARIMKKAEKNLGKARTRDSLSALNKLTEVVDGQYRIVSQPPIVIPARELAESFGGTEALTALLEEQLAAYMATLSDDRRQLLKRFSLIDAARKVVGVGSVGTRAFIALMSGRDEHDPLFLQVKEATSSVLESYLPKSEYANPGQRVVEGQRMMQATSDIFLGWTDGPQADRYFYWRQLRDMKGSAVIETMVPEALALYANACGWTLARAHARSGDPIAIAAYLGTTDEFDQSIADFSVLYADQNARDYDQFIAAIASGALDSIDGL